MVPLRRKVAPALIAGGLTLACALPARAEVDHTLESWSAAFLNPRLAPSVIGWLDLQARRGQDGTVGILRPGVGYAVLNAVSLWAGYAWIGTFRNDWSVGSEHRFWQQAQVLVSPAKGLTGVLRTRLEERFAGEGVGWRFRQLVRAQQSIHKDIFVVVWNEVFVGLNETEWGAPKGLDVNRFFMGPAFLAREGIRFEAGYLAQWAPRTERDRLIHALSLNLFAWW